MDLPARSRAEGCPSELRLDRLVAGELDDRASRALRRHADDCAGCRRRVDAILGERVAFAGFPPPRAVRHRYAARWVGVAAVVLVSAAGLLLIAPGEEHAQDTTRRKGGASLGFYVQGEQGVRRGASGETVHPGDAVRFTVRVDAPRWVTIVSVDAAGTVSVYYPIGTEPARVTAGDEIALPASTILDDVLGVETVYAVLCSVPFDVAAIARVAAWPDQPPTLDGCEIDSITLRKVATR